MPSKPAIQSSCGTRMPVLLRILQRAEGDHIIAAKERIRRFAGFRMREQLFRKGIAAFTGERAMAHEPIIRRKPSSSSARV